MRTGDPALDQAQDGLPQRVEHAALGDCGHLPQQLERGCEDRPVVDAQDRAPLVRQRSQVEDARLDHEGVQRPHGPAAVLIDLQVRGGERGVENQRVGDDRHGHAAGLPGLVVALAQDAPEPVADGLAGSLRVLVRKGRRRRLDALVENPGEAFDPRGRRAGAMQQQGQGADIAAEPAGFGQPFGRAAHGAGVEGVLELAGPHDLGRQRGAGEIVERLRVDQRDDALDLAL